MQYDLIVIGDEGCGYDGAMAAAEMNKRVALIEQHPGKRYATCGADRVASLGRAIRKLQRMQGTVESGQCGRVRRAAGMRVLRRFLAEQFRSDLARRRRALAKHAIDTYSGSAAFWAPHAVAIHQTGARRVIEGAKFLLAVGTRAARFGDIPFDGSNVFETDDILSMQSIPRSMIVIGGNRLGLDYALLFARLGVEITLIERRESLLKDPDREAEASVLSSCRDLGVAVRLGEEAIAFRRIDDHRIDVGLASGEQLVSETVLVSAERRGATDSLRLDAVGLQADERGRMWCDATGRTWVDHVYAIGTVVGFPRPARAAAVAGRRAVQAAYGQLDAVAERINRRSRVVSQLPQRAAQPLVS